MAADKKRITAFEISGGAPW